MAANNRRARNPRSLESLGIAEALERGLTRREVATAIGTSRRQVDRWCQANSWSTGRTGPRAGSGHPEWKNGRTLDKHGYVLVWVPLHPHARKPSGYVAEHRLLAEVLLFRYLKPEEVIDHIDDHPYHNWPTNIRMFPSNADHLGWTTGYRSKPTRRGSIPGAYTSTQKLLQCPDESETLAQCPSKIRERLSWYIDCHRPRIEHRNLSRRSILRAGAWRNPFPMVSTE